MRIAIIIVAVVSILLALALGLAGPGTKWGLWEYSFGLKIIRTLALPLMAAAAASAIVMVLGFVTSRPGPAILALIGLLASGAAAFVPIKMKQLVESHPFIHDVTTDFENPPVILAAASLERKNPAEYDAGWDVPREDPPMDLADVQKRDFPDIVPIASPKALEATVDDARAVVLAMGMDILEEGPVSAESGSGWRIEAVETSKWFGFKDDFIVRVTPAEGGGSVVNLRSKSRVGLSDLGANALRVRTFTEKFAERQGA